MGEPDAAAPASRRRRERRRQRRRAAGRARRARAAGAYTPDGPLDPNARERFEGTPSRCRRSASGRAGSLRARDRGAAGRGGDRGVRADGTAAATAHSPTASRRTARGGARRRPASSSRRRRTIRTIRCRTSTSRGWRARQGNINTANTEAVTAVRLGPSNGVALRELASVSFVQQNYDAARRFYLRAVQADTTRPARRRASSAARSCDSAASTRECAGSTAPARARGAAARRLRARWRSPDAAGVPGAQDAGRAAGGITASLDRPAVSSLTG